MDRSLAQNTMNTFSEARHYLNVNLIMVIFDHQSNIIAAALGLGTLLPSENSGKQTLCIQRNRSTLELCRRRHDVPFIERTIGYN